MKRVNVMSGSDNPEAPKIEFPCEYPIKVMGDAGDELHSLVVNVMERHAPGFDQASISIRDSSKGTYQSITVTIIATGKPQLQSIFDDLKDNKLVKMVL
ncbi:MAG: DUF493 domain-containing protein [Porticoccaceae bacterium]